MIVPPVSRGGRADDPDAVLQSMLCCMASIDALLGAEQVIADAVRDAAALSAWDRWRDGVVREGRDVVIEFGVVRPSGGPARPSRTAAEICKALASVASSRASGTLEEWVALRDGFYRRLERWWAPHPPCGAALLLDIAKQNVRLQSALLAKCPELLAISDS